MTEPKANSTDISEPILFRIVMTLLAVGLCIAICLLPASPGLSPSGQRMAGVAVMMAVLWCTQALPIAVTSLLPLVAFPLLQIQTADVVSRSYMNSTILLYLSGFAIAIGVERWGLHRRLALSCLMLIGTSPRRIVLGFMLGTALISMWISNTATTLLMFPIGLAVINSLEAGKGLQNSGHPEFVPASQYNPLATALLLGIAYAASIGGICTLVGSPTNGVYAGYWASTNLPAEEIARYSVSSGQWMVMFVPISATMLLLCWLMLCLPIPKDMRLGEATHQEIVKRYHEQGRLKSGEKKMLCVFIAVALLWLTRASIDVVFFTIPGWESGLNALIKHWYPEAETSGWLHDSTAGMFMLIVMFLIPARNEQTGKTDFLMDWKTIESKTPWGVLLLFGGGFALSSACGTTGFSMWLGEWIANHIDGMHNIAKIFSVSWLVILLSEFASNTATIAALLPVLDKTAEALSLDPRLLMLPATAAASCGFMLPIATPPNAIVFSSGRIKVTSMLKAGFWLNLVGAITITFFTWVWILRVSHVAS